MKKTFIKKTSFILVLLIILSSNSVFAAEIATDKNWKNFDRRAYTAVTTR